LEGWEEALYDLAYMVWWRRARAYPIEKKVWEAVRGVEAYGYEALKNALLIRLEAVLGYRPARHWIQPCPVGQGHGAYAFYFEAPDTMWIYICYSGHMGAEGTVLRPVLVYVSAL